MTDDDFKVPLSVLNLLKQKDCSRFLWVDYSEVRLQGLDLITC